MKRKLLGLSVLGLALSMAAKTANATPSVNVYDTYFGVNSYSGFAVAAEVRSGSNGNENSPDLDFDLIDPGWSGDGGYITWDTNYTSNFTTGTCLATLTVDLSAGTASFIVTDSNSVTHEADYTGLSGHIDYIAITAATQDGGYSGWHDPSVVFYTGGTATESYSSSSDVPVEDLTATSDYSGEEELDVGPSSSYNDKVVITGEFQLDATSAFPGPNDVYGQILVYTH